MDENDFDFNGPGESSHAPSLFDDGRAADSVPLHLYVTLPTNQLPKTPAAAGGTIGNSLRAFTMLKKPTPYTIGTRTVAVGRVDTPAAAAPPPPPAPEAVERYQWRSEQRRFVEWDSASTAEFFDALSQFGTDFSTIAILFPKLTRADVVHKYKIEMKRQSDRVLGALSAANRRPIDLAKFEERKRIGDEMKQEPTRPLNAEEEEQLNAFIQDPPAAVEAAPATANSTAAVPPRQRPPSHSGSVSDAVKDEFSFGDVSDDVPLTVLYSTTRQVDVDNVPLADYYAQTTEKSRSRKRARSKEQDSETLPTKDKKKSEDGQPKTGGTSSSSSKQRSVSSPSRSVASQGKSERKSKSKKRDTAAAGMESAGQPLSPFEQTGSTDFVSPEPMATDFPADELIAEYFSPTQDGDDDDWGI